MVGERAARGRVTLHCDVAPDVGTVRGDELKLKQVVLNLVSNAVKFTPEGGSVTVEARGEQDSVVVTVRDTGVGVPEEQRERIFEAFQRGGRDVRTTTEGTGLGLTLSRQIVELHGGRLAMHSTVGEGSTFWFELPRVPPGAEPSAQPQPRAAAAEGAGHALVVEDDWRSADLLRVYLEEAGYRVSIARDGVTGLDLARELKPTAVILDILLPRLGGWDLLTRLKNDPETAEIPVVIASMLDERAAGFALGAAEYLVKPVDRGALLEALSHCVAQADDPGTVVVIDDGPDEP
jgi:CheY-like chemotaxis protein